MKTDRKTWLITGGAGFIGSAIARELVKQKQKVIVFDNFSSSDKTALQDIKKHIKIIRGDITKAAQINKACKGVDYLLHHAALVSVPESVKNPLLTQEINVTGAANVLGAAVKNGVKKVIFASSSAVYGNGGNAPRRETSPLLPLSPYALSKYQGEQLCALYSNLYNLPTVCLRYFNVFGPGQKTSSAYAAVIAKFMAAAGKGGRLHIYGDGKQSRDFIYVEDVVKANLLAVKRGAAGEVYNVACGASINLLELADIIDRVFQKKTQRVFAPKRPGDIRASSANISKIKKLGFKTGVTLKEGIEKIAAAITP